MVRRTDIEGALKELVSNEAGSIFQALAVILAKKRWPELIACERKWDRGLDAHAHPSMKIEEKGLACSLTADLSKIEKDATKVQKNFPGLKQLIFATPGKVSNQKKIKWAKSIKKDFGFQLIVVSREDIVTDLLDPSNWGLCRTPLGMPIEIPAPAANILGPVKDACKETIDQWLRVNRLHSHFLLPLNLLRVSADPQSTRETISIDAVRKELLLGARLIVEGPAGAGKTTTLLQLGKSITDDGRLCLVVDLPTWIDSNNEILDFVTQSQSFRSRNIQASALAQLLGVEHVDFLLNGWNEISGATAASASRKLRKLEQDYPAAGILLTTRAHLFQPPLGTSLVRIEPLTKDQRATYVQKEIGGRANDLLSQIQINEMLEALTRTPLILAEVTQLFAAGKAIPTSRLEVLAAMALRIEGSKEHGTALNDVPLLGKAPVFLADLARKMSSESRIDLTDDSARACVGITIESLLRTQQLKTAPEPTAILTTLTSHHILQRLDHPAVTFRFQHQQFQEFYSALHVIDRLRDLAKGDDPAKLRAFQEQLIDLPFLGESIEMVAEAIGVRSTLLGSESEVTAMGETLVSATLAVDPIFAAMLSRKCGENVWSRVRAKVGERLRNWHSLPHKAHRQCALAAMVATGSPDFLDILLPLWSSEDSQERLRTHRATGPFHVSSLGPKWRETVAAWSPKARAEFVSEAIDENAELVEEFALKDPAQEVRLAAIRMLDWHNARDALMRVLSAMPEDELAESLRKGIDGENVPKEVIKRAVVPLRKMATNAKNNEDRLRTFLLVQKIGDSSAIAEIKKVLEALTDPEWTAFAKNDNHHLITSVMEAVSEGDGSWCTEWISKKLVTGDWWSQRWVEHKSIKLPNALANEMVGAACNSELEYGRMESAKLCVANGGNIDTAKKLWQRLHELKAQINAAADKRSTGEQWKLANQVESLLKESDPATVASAALELAFAPTNFDQVCALLDVLEYDANSIGEWRSKLTESLRSALRDFLVRAVPTTIEKDDPSGRVKAQMALALARFGNPEDLSLIKDVIAADLQRVRAGREARTRGESSPKVDGASTSWLHWYTRSLVWLGSNEAEAQLVQLLEEPEYEKDAAGALAAIAFPTQDESSVFFRGSKDDTATSATEEGRGERFAEALRRRIQAIRDEQSRSDKPDAFNGRLKALAEHLARLDGEHSCVLVLQIMALPGRWDCYTCTDALEFLLKSRSKLSTDLVLAVLNPIIEQILKEGTHNNQNDYLLKRCLRVLPFVDNPSAGVQRLREVLGAVKLRGYEFRDIVPSLGKSQTDDALDLLIELATSAGDQFHMFARDWVKSVADLGTPRANATLIGLVDPDSGSKLSIPGEAHELLAEALASISMRDPDSRASLKGAFGKDTLSQAQVTILAHTCEKLATEEAVLEGLALMSDKRNPHIPWPLLETVKKIAVEHRPYQTFGYTLVPRNSSKLRQTLFQMAFTDQNRCQSAFIVLGEIEGWRLEYGKPTSEPRHPEIRSGHPWPPLEKFPAKPGK